MKNLRVPLQASVAAILFLSTQAFADAPAASGPSALMNMVPLLFAVAVIYFLMLRPQMKKQKETTSFLSALKHGDSVVTAGGILGVIREIQGGIVTLEISQGVRVKLLKNQIMQSAENIQ